MAKGLPKCNIAGSNGGTAAARGIAPGASREAGHITLLKCGPRHPPERALTSFQARSWAARPRSVAPLP